MGVRNLDDLDAYRLSIEFKRAVYHLVHSNARATADYRYRDQLFDAALSVPANIAEGFARRTTKDFCHFLAYSRGSVAEAITRLEDGVDRGHFTMEACEHALTLARRTAAAIAGLQRNLRPFLTAPGRR